MSEVKAIEQNTKQENVGLQFGKHRAKKKQQRTWSVDSESNHLRRRKILPNPQNHLSSS